MNHRKVWIVFILFLCAAAFVNAQSLGDVDSNGVINIVDALMIAQYTVGKIPAGFAVAAADANADGNINIVDALVVAQFSVGLITSLPPGTVMHVDNPFAGVKWYIDEDWSTRASAGGGAAIAGYNTGVWLTSVASLTDGIGLQGHLEAALTQQAGMILLVLNNLPDCSTMVSPEIIIIEPPIARTYATEFIDPIVAILSNPAYRNLRIVIALEPRVLPNLTTNLDMAACQEMNGAGGYMEAIQYALNKLHPLPNVYIYMDIATSSWLGWQSNFIPAVTLYTNVVKGTIAGVNSVDGFIVNTANYCPLEEPFLPDPDLLIGNTAVKGSTFYEWNPYFGELKYARDLHAAFVQQGFPSTIGTVIDTSRNGWGGADRPIQVSTATDVDAYVNESRIDRRSHRANWCNIKFAGLGIRPVANPEPLIDAYVWAFPPGFSDGVSSPGIIDPDNPSKIFDAMCDPAGTSKYNKNFSTDAMQAPHAGHWNQAHFDVLLQNAYPPLN